MKLLNNHCSVRNYLSTKIPQDLLDNILYSGIRSSNTGNMQLYSIVVTLDDDRKKALAPCHFNQAMVLQAPVLLTICFDINRFYKWCETSNTSADFKNLLWLLNGTIDVSILAQNICIAAENEGLGICYLGTTLYNAPEISTLLNLPVGVIPITALIIGYPAFPHEKSDRLNLDAVVHYEVYKEYQREEIDRIYADKESLESSKKFVTENNKERLAQVYTEVRYKKTDNEYFSRKLLNLLKDQGFKFE